MNTICLLETAKQTQTKQIDVNIQPASLTNEFVNFIENNVKSNPGKSSIRFNIYEPLHNLKISMHTMDRGFTMNEEMAEFLIDNPDVDINVEVTSS